LIVLFQNKLIMLKIKLLIIAMLICQLAFTQSEILEKDDEIIQSFIENFNQKNYNLLEKDFFLLGRIIISSDQLESTYSEYHRQYGNMKMDTAIRISPFQFSIKLFFDSLPTTPFYHKFLVNNHNKVVGMGFSRPFFLYKKTQSNNLKLPIQSSTIDSLVNNLTSETQFNGSIAIHNGNGTIIKSHYGFLDLKLQKPINDSTLYDIASCAKQFTSFGILRLQERGLLNIQDPVSKYIPEFPYSEVTIENLLNHTSGLPDYMSMMDKEWNKDSFASNYDVISIMNKNKPKVYFENNSQFEYSNTGYIILSIIIENTTGVKIKDFLNKEFFDPIGMKNTTIYNTRRWKNELLPNYAKGYVYLKNSNTFHIPDSLDQFNYAKYLDPITGDGAISSNLDDLILWMEELKATKVVSNINYDLATSKTTCSNGLTYDYGYGLFVSGDDIKSEKLIYHTGSWPGYRSVMMLFPALDIYIIILNNTEFAQTTKLADSIAELLLNNNDTQH
jgi:CubicO group peptidase (beta-lactamase class C family)